MRWLNQTVVAMLALATLGCASIPTTQEFKCVRGDHSKLLAGDDPRLTQFWEAIDQGWITDAVRCEIGDYVLYAPADRNLRNYVLLRGDQPEVIRLNEYDVSVMDDMYLHVSLRDGDKDGHSDAVSYATWRFHGDRYVDAIDWNLDGQPDMRTTESAGGETRKEAWVNDRWQEVFFKSGLRLAEAPEKQLQKLGDGSFAVVQPEE